MMKSLLTNRWFLCISVFLNVFFWLGLVLIADLILEGGMMHGEAVAFYPKNIVRMVGAVLAVAGMIGLTFKIKKLYICLFVYGIIGLGHCLFDLVDTWYCFLFLADPRVNPAFSTIAFLYPLVFYGGVLEGYKLLKE